MELINLLRQETTFIEELIGVDCDSEVLTSSFKKFQIRAFDYLNARNKPLKISCFQVSNIDILIIYKWYICSCGNTELPHSHATQDNSG